MLYATGMYNNAQHVCELLFQLEKESNNSSLQGKECHGMSRLDLQRGALKKTVADVNGKRTPRMTLRITEHHSAGTEGSTNKTTFPIVDTHQKELSGFNPTFVATSDFLSLNFAKLSEPSHEEKREKIMSMKDYESMNQHE